jgi:hypothetical protein
MEVEEAAEPPADVHTSCHLDHGRGGDEAIADTLVIPFGVLVLDVLRYGAPEVPFPDRNQPVQAFFFDRPHDPFGITHSRWAHARGSGRCGYAIRRIEFTRHKLKTGRSARTE